MPEVDPDDFDNAVIDGFAQLLVTAGIGAYNPDGTYQSTDTAITAQILPPTPDNAIALSTYAVADDPSLSDSTVGLQVFTRGVATTPNGDPRPTNKLSSRVFNQLHGMQATTLASGVYVVTCDRRSSALVGMDDNRRWERVDNYYVKVWRPSLNRT